MVSLASDARTQQLNSGESTFDLTTLECIYPCLSRDLILPGLHLIIACLACLRRAMILGQAGCRSNTGSLVSPELGTSYFQNITLAPGRSSWLSSLTSSLLSTLYFEDYFTSDYLLSYNKQIESTSGKRRWRKDVYTDLVF